MSIVESSCHSDNIAVLVVVYGKDLTESKTLQTMMKSDVSVLELTIYNNGPREVDIDNYLYEFFVKNCKKVKLITSLKNDPLSIVYNSFLISNQSCSKFVFLDDDSILAADYFKKIIDSAADVIVPRILSVEDDKYYYPLENGMVVKEDKRLIAMKVMSITSGLTINKKVVDIFSENYKNIFDEKFALYGIDTSFFLRLRRILSNKKQNVLNVEANTIIKHSLSRVSNRASRFREKERLYDAAITARYYPEYINKKRATVICIKYILTFKLDFLFIFILTYFRGKHPRCR